MAMKDYKEGPEMALQVEIETAEGEDEAQYAEMSPTGNYSKKALNNLVKATNGLLPLFEQTPDYPTFAQDISGELPTDFVRVLAMFQGAISSAVANDAIDPEFDFTLEELVDDNSLQLVAGKLQSVAKNRDFRNFLKEPPEEGIVEEEVEMTEEGQMETPMTAENMSEEEMNNLFMGRL
jgi:hypothetical protein